MEQTVATSMVGAPTDYISVRGWMPSSTLGDGQHQAKIIHQNIDFFLFMFPNVCAL